MSKYKNVLAKKGKDKFKKYKRRRDAFIIHVTVKPTDEKFTLDDIYNDMTVSQLKDELEYATGIPKSIQRLSYLDEGELQDHKDIKSNDFVPGCMVQLKVWHMYQELIEAVAANDIERVFRLGVTSTSDYHTPASDYMTKNSQKAWLEERAFVALCLAVHRGHDELTVKLIENGADVNKQTSTGKTPLHLASAVGNGKMVDTLLHHGADISAEDKNGNTALSVAEKFGNKICSRHLFQFQWQQRAKNSTPSKNMPLFAHQYFDSSLPVWKRGASAQIYVANILKPGEFEGTSLSSPRAGRHPSITHKELRNATFLRESPKTSDLEPDDWSLTGSGSLPPINKKSHVTNLKRPISYQEWLDKQKKKEKNMTVENKKQTKEQKKKKSQDVELSKEYNEELGCEKWLQDIEKGKESQLQSSLTKSMSTIQDGLLPIHHDGALRLYLRSLGKSRSGVKFEDWLNEKEVQLNQLIQQKSYNVPLSHSINH